MPLDIMCVGTSITHGVKYSSTDPGKVMAGYRYYLWRELTALGVSFRFFGSQVDGPSDMTDRDHEGRNGWTLHQMRDNVASWFGVSGVPNAVFMEGGTNDLAQPEPMGGFTPAETVGHLGEFLDNAQAAGPNTIIFVSPPPPYLSDSTVGVQLAEYARLAEIEVLSRFAAGENVRWVPMALTPAMISDTVHPNEIGYEWMSIWWLQALQREYPSLITSVPTRLAATTSSYRPSSPWARAGATTISLTAVRDQTALRVQLEAKFDILSVDLVALTNVSTSSVFLDGPRATVVLTRAVATAALSAGASVTTSEGPQSVSFGDGGLAA